MTTLSSFSAALSALTPPSACGYLGMINLMSSKNLLTLAPALLTPSSSFVGLVLSVVCVTFGKDD